MINVYNSSGTIPEFEVSARQHWVVVGCLMPIVIALYLLLILVCYYLFCKKDAYNQQDRPNDGQSNQVSMAILCKMFFKPIIVL